MTSFFYLIDLGCISLGSLGVTSASLILTIFGFTHADFSPELLLKCDLSVSYLIMKLPAYLSYYVEQEKLYCYLLVLYSEGLTNENLNF